MDYRPPDEAQVKGWMTSLSNWGRWGKDDQLGTINHITPEKRRAAAALVREGITISCARPIAYDEPDIVTQPVHLTVATGESAPPEGRGGTGDMFLIGPHGLAITHLDALCHNYWDGRMYNGHPAKLVTAREGATALAIDALGDGVATRGVLLDITKVCQKDWLEPGEGIFPEDLEAAERAQGVRVAAGDALLVRTGHYLRRLREGPKPLDGRNLQYPGLQAACLPWLHERQVALLGCDTANDVQPDGYTDLRLPIHTVGIVAMGLWLLDNCNHEELQRACARLGRWEFLFVLAPLKLKNGTGSPMNPIALL
jgi:kynurenine formamidase